MYITYSCDSAFLDSAQSECFFKKISSTKSCYIHTVYTKWMCMWDDENIRQNWITIRGCIDSTLLSIMPLAVYACFLWKPWKICTCYSLDVYWVNPFIWNSWKTSLETVMHIVCANIKLCSRYMPQLHIACMYKYKV